MAKDIERSMLLVRDVGFLAAFSTTAAFGLAIAVGSMGAGMIASRVKEGLVDV